MPWKEEAALGRRLEAVAKAVGGGYCRLQMSLRLVLGVRGTVAGHRVGALEGGGGTSPPSQERLGRRLEGVAKAVGGGYCRLQMPLRPALGIRGTVAGHRLGALEGGGYLPLFQRIPGRGGRGGNVPEPPLC